MLAELSKYMGIIYIPNAMSRTTGYFVDANVGGSLDNRDAIITSVNGRFGYSHIVGMTNMNAIRVRAICGGIYVKVACPYDLAVSDEHVNPFTVKGIEASYNSICDLVES